MCSCIVLEIVTELYWWSEMYIWRTCAFLGDAAAQDTKFLSRLGNCFGYVQTMDIPDSVSKIHLVVAHMEALSWMRATVDV